MKKKEIKDRQRELRIWDKKTASTRIPLKKFRDADIPPAKIDEQTAHKYSREQEDFISQAKKIVRSWISYPKDTWPQSQIEFIEQKKEMFLVELAYNTIKVKTAQLELKQEKKMAAIQESEIQLNNDD